MAITDADQLTELQLVLQEDATFSNGLWTLAEVLAYFNQRQYRFLAETKILAATAVLGWVPDLDQLPLPPDWIATLAVLWHDFASDQWTPLPPADHFQMDHVLTSLAVPTTATPQAYRDVDTTDTLTLGVSPAPISAGELDLLYVPLSEILDGQGQLFDIPDDWVPYIKYGVYSDMLSKDGRGQDLLRARYAEQRFAEGVALAQSLVEGY